MSGWLGKMKTKAVELKNKAQEKVKKASGDFLDNHVNKTYRVNQRKYKVKRSIAEGGFGFVYCVENEQGDIFALKHSILQTPEQLASAQCEIDVMVRVTRAAGSISAWAYSIWFLSCRSENFLESPILFHWWMQR